MFDKDPRRCRGACRYSVRCKRYGEPTGEPMEFWCFNHAHQRDSAYGEYLRELDTEEGRTYFGVHE